MKSGRLDRDRVLAGLKDIKPILADRYGVTSLALFGSFVRNEEREESDIDVVVELREPDLFTLVHIKEALQADFNRPVDVIPYTPLMNVHLKTRIQNEAVYV